MCFLEYSNDRNLHFQSAVFYLPYIDICFPVERKKMRTQDVITERQKEIRKADLKEQAENETGTT